MRKGLPTPPPPTAAGGSDDDPEEEEDATITDASAEQPKRTSGGVALPGLVKKGPQQQGTQQKQPQQKQPLQQRGPPHEISKVKKTKLLLKLRDMVYIASFGS